MDKDGSVKFSRNIRKKLLKVRFDDLLKIRDILSEVDLEPGEEIVLTRISRECENFKRKLKERT